VRGAGRERVLETRGREGEHQAAECEIGWPGFGEGGGGKRRDGRGGLGRTHHAGGNDQ